MGYPDSGDGNEPSALTALGPGVQSAVSNGRKTWKRHKHLAETYVDGAAVKLSLLHGLSQAETARLLGMSKSKVSLHARRPTMLYTDSGDTTALSLGDDRFLAEVWGSEETANKVREWCAVYDIQYGLVNGEHGRRSIIPDVTVRFLTVDDADKIRDLHERLSEHDEYMRFLTPSPRHLDSLVAMLCRHDSTHAAIGAFHGDDLVGVANYVVTGTTPSGLTDAEFALVVAGDERGQGVGTTLIRRLAIIAYERGVRHLSTEILAENTGMLEVLRNRGWSHALHPDGLCVHVDLDLYPGLELEAAVGPNAAAE